ncbi:hypothetical protein HK105_206555 [Polyrhizophydium stewartii]|uniref:Ankyrin repeat domain-containing protein n=1 Tax=Polyrhizophydium stewartii TaxID=2732419 RepID=A0ABR4N335_9FUNG
MPLDVATMLAMLGDGRLLAAEVLAQPDEQRTAVWRQALESDWQGDLSMLPPLPPSTTTTTTTAIGSTTISTTTISESVMFAAHSRPTLQRAVAHGAVDAQTAQRVAIRRGWVDMLDFDRPQCLATAAASEGAVWLLEGLIEARMAAAPTAALAEAAAGGGHLPALQFVHERMPPSTPSPSPSPAAAASAECGPGPGSGSGSGSGCRPWPASVGDAAARSGSVELVAWLAAARPECLAPSAVDAAAAADRGDVVRWLADHQPGIGCTAAAFVGAAANNSVAMLDLLADRFPAAAAAAAAAGVRAVASDPAAVEWLAARGLAAGADALVAHAAAAGSVDGVRRACGRLGVTLAERHLAAAHAARRGPLLVWAYTDGGVAFAADTAGALAARWCNTDVLAWAADRDPAAAEAATRALVDATARAGDPALVEWWAVRRGVAFAQRELEAAAAAGNVRMVARLVARGLGNAADAKQWDLAAARRVAVEHKADDVVALLDALAARTSAAATA